MCIAFSLSEKGMFSAYKGKERRFVLERDQIYTKSCEEGKGAQGRFFCCASSCKACDCGV